MDDARDARAAARAENQHGTITREELFDLGATRAWIKHRIATGVLRPLFPGVYAFGHGALRREGFWLAAVKATGGSTTLTHRPAGALRGLNVPKHVPLEVTTPGEARSRAASTVRVGGRTVHYPAIHVVRNRLDPADVRLWRSIPCTTIERTLIDLCDVLDDDELVAVTDAMFHLDKPALREALRRAPKRRAHTRLRYVLDDGPRSRSELERAFRAFARRGQLPRPECNVRIEGLLVDCVWRDRRVVLELDSQAWHAHMGARRNDFDRDAKLLARGWTPLRAAWADVTYQPERGLARVRPFLLGG